MKFHLKAILVYFDSRKDSRELVLKCSNNPFRDSLSEKSKEQYFHLFIHGCDIGYFCSSRYVLNLRQNPTIVILLRFLGFDQTCRIDNS